MVKTIGVRKNISNKTKAGDKKTNDLTFSNLFFLANGIEDVAIFHPPIENIATY
jgi:hypothetical protein